MDLGYQGDPFTWSNKRLGNHQIRERLDRGLTNASWRILFDKAILTHESMIGFDHCPLRLSFHTTSPNRRTPFRFDTRLVSQPGVNRRNRGQTTLTTASLEPSLAHLWHRGRISTRTRRLYNQPGTRSVQEWLHDRRGILLLIIPILSYARSIKLKN
ncbi:hypothetical protein LINPERPRIM_LOCUS5088 [Linum perenne]